MSWSNSTYCVLCFLLFGCEEAIEAEGSVAVEANTIDAAIARSRYLIDAETLLKIEEDENVRIIDFRKEKEYRKDHIQGAIHLWRDHIEDHTYPFKGMMAHKDSISKLLGDLGISDTDLLVVYDNRGSCDAARFWWVMQNLDFDRVKILDGGLKAWLAAGGKVDALEVAREATEFNLPESPSYRYLIGKEEIEGILNNDGPDMLIDTRTHEEFTGKRRKAGAASAGRIPGSHRIDWSEAIDFHGSMKIKSNTELEKIYDSIILSKDRPIITYCHTGVRSALTTFVLTQILDYKNVKNYDGSWTEWSYSQGLPIEKDSITTILN